MPPIVIDLKKTDDPIDAVHLAVEFLAAGKIVALPTETVYGIAASALNPAAADRLGKIKCRSSKQPFSIAVKSADDAYDYVPTLSVMGKRLARRCWPGPITLVVDGTHPDSVITQLPDIIRPMVLIDGAVGLRVPAHEVFQSVSRLSVGPMLLTSANLHGEPDCTDCESIVERLGDQVDLILNDGPSRYGQSSTVVKVRENEYEILRAGVFGDSAMKRMSSFMALLVCTGNTCRSPMAELLLKKRIAEKLKCKIEELDDKGVIVTSAGVAAMPGDKASQESIDVLQNMELDLSSHESQPVSDQLLTSADLILTMTKGHRQALISHWPDIAERTHVLCIDGSDVSDPIGGPMSLYESCAKQIDDQLKTWVEKIDLGIPE
ncbi:L-threonylcarbamoyladenylate synthase [Pirellulaceae bacterium]|jgi:protein-tyrosine phosphatase|nr:L-threonylcarbamoyladenylate synthase [Pirellulaceae bacterium]